MQITRKIDKTNARYDILELTHAQFISLLHAYERFLELIHRGYPEGDELLSKLREMAAKEQITI